MDRSTDAGVSANTPAPLCSTMSGTYCGGTFVSFWSMHSLCATHTGSLWVSGSTSPSPYFARLNTCCSIRRS